MKYIFLFLVFLHGLIHLLGFVKGFGLSEVKELSLSISKPMGFLWLVAAVLFVAYGILFLNSSKLAWILGLLTVLVSQILIVLFWSDAKFGTVPNLIVLVVVLTSIGNYNFQNRVDKETDELLSRNNVREDRIVTEHDVEELPEPVKNWLRSSGIVGRSFIHCGKVIQKATMQMKPNQKDWLTADAVQYTTLNKPAFIWTVDAKMNPLLYFLGRDKFEHGHGAMLIKVNGLFNIVNAKGKKLDEGSLQRYLGEMVWFPTLAMSPYITWEPIDATTAKATMTYKGTTGSGTFYFNENGDVVSFSALRYQGNEADSKRYPWVMDILNYKTFEGIKVPVNMTSTWKLDDGDWTWLKLEVTDIQYNQKVYNKNNSTVISGKSL